MKNPLFIFSIAIIVLLSLYSAKGEATVVNSFERLPKYDCNTTPKQVMKKVIKRKIAQIKEERVVLIKPTCPIVDEELARKKRIGYGAERDLVRDTLWTKYNKTFNDVGFGGFVNVNAFVPFIGNGSNNVVTKTEVTQPSAVPIPNALVLFVSVIFLMLRRR